jgi:hypothetical protein
MSEFTPAVLTLLGSAHDIQFFAAQVCIAAGITNVRDAGPAMESRTLRRLQGEIDRHLALMAHQPRLVVHEALPVNNVPQLITPESEPVANLGHTSTDTGFNTSSVKDTVLSVDSKPEEPKKAEDVQRVEFAPSFFDQISSIATSIHLEPAKVLESCVRYGEKPETVLARLGELRDVLLSKAAHTIQNPLALLKSVLKKGGTINMPEFAKPQTPAKTGKAPQGSRFDFIPVLDGYIQAVATGRRYRIDAIYETSLDLLDDEGRIVGLASHQYKSGSFIVVNDRSAPVVSQSISSNDPPLREGKGFNANFWRATFQEACAKRGLEGLL